MLDERGENTSVAYAHIDPYVYIFNTWWICGIEMMAGGDKTFKYVKRSVLTLGILISIFITLVRCIIYTFVSSQLRAIN